MSDTGVEQPPQVAVEPTPTQYRIMRAGPRVLAMELLTATGNHVTFWDVDDAKNLMATFQEGIDDIESGPVAPALLLPPQAGALLVPGRDI